MREMDIYSWVLTHEYIFEIEDEVIRDEDMKQSILMGAELMIDERSGAKREGIYLLSKLYVEGGKGLLGDDLTEFLKKNVKCIDILMAGREKDKSGDHKGALALYQEAHDKGSLEGSFNCANCYIYSIGGDQVTEKGLEYLRKCKDVGMHQRMMIKLFSNSQYSQGSFELKCLFSSCECIYPHVMNICCFFLSLINSERNFS